MQNCDAFPIQDSDLEHSIEITPVRDRLKEENSFYICVRLPHCDAHCKRSTLQPMQAK